VAGLRTFSRRLTLVDAGGAHAYTLPADSGPIVDMSVSDAGDRIALLRRVQQQGDGRIEVWSLPTGDEPLASVEFPLYDSAFVTANGSFSAMSVYSARTSGAERAMQIYVYDSDRGALRPLSEEHPFASQWISAAVCGEWVWVVQEEGLVGWRPGQAPIELPGAVGDRLAFSPSGDHLLAYRVLRVTTATSAEVLFRVIDLSSLEEIKRVTHLIADDSEAQFALTPNLGLLELRLSFEGQLQVEELSW
jgi:hypothetical protein